MGDMTIKGFQEASLRAIALGAAEEGVSPEEFARDILEREMRKRFGQRAVFARTLLSKQQSLADQDSVALLRELRVSE
jgi:plasmid stability protein